MIERNQEIQNQTNPVNEKSLWLPHVWSDYEAEGEEEEDNSGDGVDMELEEVVIRRESVSVPDHCSLGSQSVSPS